MLFDSHAHINEDRYTPEQRQAMIDGIEANELLGFVADIGYDYPSSVQAAKDAAENEFICAAVGVHPHDAKSMTEEIYQGIRELSRGVRVSAIGEIGLDYHYMRSEKSDQRYWFRRQIRLANELRMPIVVHSREADRETMDILVEEGAFSDERKSWFPERKSHLSDARRLITVPDARVDIHCFSGSAELGKEYVKLGATLGICGPLTYNNNKKTVKVVQEVPIEYLMVETDTPYLTPVPLRGKPNQPWYVEYTARKLAEIKGISFEEAADITFQNAKNFYGL